MEDRNLGLTKFIGVDDVVAALGCSKSLAYRHLRSAAGRPAGSRGLLRVPVAAWETYARATWGSQTTTPTGESHATSKSRQSRRSVRHLPSDLEIPVTQPRSRGV